jgi:FHA domain-containing protein
MIKIAVALYDNVAPAHPLSAVFDHERKTMGRSDDNFFVLPDPKHLVSRSQAAVWSDGTRHALMNLSRATPMRLNGRQIEFNTEVDIVTGDLIQVGLYVLRAEPHTEGALVQDGPPVRASGPSYDEAPRTVAPELEELAARSAAQTASEAAPPPPAPAAAGAASTQALKEAFLRGAGIPAGAISSELTPEMMEMLGKVMASSLQGAIDLLSLRSLVKREARADVTMVVVRNNNPLKFFPDSQTVLTQMLRKKMPGFMEPLESVDDAWHDLHGHALGIVAGMRAGMGAMLERLNPDNFALKQAEPTLMDKLNPARRQALMWTEYVRQHGEIVAEAKGDFQNLFGAPFLAAYEKEVESYNDGLARG